MFQMKFSDYWWIDYPIFMIFFSVFIVSMLTALMGVEITIATVSGSAWIAPIAEETFKFLALIFGTAFGIIYTAIFALAEFSNFINWAIAHDADDPTNIWTPYVL